MKPDGFLRSFSALLSTYNPGMTCTLQPISSRPEHDGRLLDSADDLGKEIESGHSLSPIWKPNPTKICEHIYWRIR